MKRDPCVSIPQTSTLGSPGVPRGGGGSLGGCRASSGRGRGARSSLCCPGCGFWWNGGLCSVCTVRFGDRDSLNSCLNHGENSCGLNLRMVRTQDIQGEERSKRLEVGSLIVGNTPDGARLANYLRWAPRRWPVEMWEYRAAASDGARRWERCLAGRCGVTVSILHTPEWLSKLPGPGEPLRSALGWTPLLHTSSSGVWLFRGALQGEQLLAALVSSVDWVFRGNYRTAWAVAPRCRCSYA